MKFTDAIVIFVMASIFITGFLFVFDSCLKLEKASLEKKEEITRDKFIFESFIKTCSGDDLFEDLNEWQKYCRTVFKLDYVGWCVAEDFMGDSEAVTDKELMCGVWIVSGKEKEVFCRWRR